MKKKSLLVIPVALTLLLSLAACGNDQKKSENSQAKTEHKQSKKKTDTKEKEQKAKSSQEAQSDSANPDTQHGQTQNDNSNQNNQSSTADGQAVANSANANNTDNSATNGSEASQNQPQESQSVKNQAAGTTDVVNTSEAAINILKNEFGNSSDYSYGVLSTDNGVYEIEVTSKSIRAQGGSGTVGIYDVMPDGTYNLKY
ncbi:hypothetical protein [Fructilactobacillus carniphilus]|uniref:Lipoprotein n=1 Tax=Fructilactobacillus carniphilus TaxID=2940297 RepID=A0ABY5BWN8_9LACO|nr:hypothetical protein [Fructilactobacillus carniphilus]USS90482.1 hypothetical protein M3M37_06490 [Fructilactobacillus carniphilus]